MKKKWLFIIAMTVSMILLLSACGVKPEKKRSFELSDQDLKTAHNNFSTKIVDTSFIPDGEPDVPPKGVFDLVYYPTKEGNMAAYLTPDPKDGQRYPAVIWIHGGYGGIGDWFWLPQPIDNDQSGKAFRDAGIVMMIPSFRGENVNPGNYEMFYGEIEDLESARQYVAALPYVDPSRIYLIGHSTGGTTVLLGNEYSKGFRAAFSLGGVPDLKLRIEGGRMSVAVPFDQGNPEEFALRSPRRFLNSLKSPTFYFEGERAYWSEFDEMQEVAKEKKIPFYAYEIKNGGNHFNILYPTTKLIAKKILADSEEEVNIRFTREDIQWIERNIRK